MPMTRLHEGGEDARHAQQQADLHIRQIKIVSHQRPSGARNTAHQFVEELDGEKYQ